MSVCDKGKLETDMTSHEHSVTEPKPQAEAPGTAEDFEGAVFMVAKWMAEKDGCDDIHHLIWEGSPPEPWGEVWQRYEGDARAALIASGLPAENAKLRSENATLLEAFEGAQADCNTQHDELSSLNAQVAEQSKRLAFLMDRIEAARDLVARWRKQSKSAEGKNVDAGLALGIVANELEAILQPQNETETERMGRWMREADEDKAAEIARLRKRLRYLEESPCANN